MLEQRARQRVDRAMLLGGGRPLVEVAEAVAQAAEEHLAAVAVGGGVGRLDVEEHGADLGGDSVGCASQSR